MKTLKSTLLVLLVLCALLVTQSCTDACEDVVCLNGGTCVEGSCECPDGTLGTNCENFDPAQVQALLDGGKTPLELYTGGVPLDSLYGKMYEGGLIFYLDITDGTGMVAATSDQSPAAEWGCRLTNISGLNDVSSFPTNPETEEGVRIGDGEANTDAILSGCTTAGIAAKLCRDIGADWFLPSRGELNLMYTNLHQKGHGGFEADWYWSSSEFDEVLAWFQNFDDGNQDFVLKNFDIYVRAARTF